MNHCDAPATPALAVVADEVDRLLREPDAAWWAAYPDSDPGDDPGIDCVELSDRLAARLRARGVTADVIEGSDADYPHDPLLDFHRWVRAAGVNVDVTVRQFVTVLGPAGHAAHAAPVPLRWPAGQPHPVIPYGTTRVVPDREQVTDEPLNT